ncbi:IG [Nesidiocoris tenuis]|uniref:IG n=2 Tax=Nesidiocoris tenuis TaxID=355587 RepID=A0ABN7A9W9_9HEMI|nr:IG [Nesidiocoris tenuis]
MQPFLVFLFIPAIHVGGSMMPEEEKKPVFLSTMVGDTVIFSCDLDFPQDVVVPYTLNWNKEGERIISIQDGVLVYAKDSYAGRVSNSVLGNRADLNLSAVRKPDEGWFECRLFFPNRSPPTRLNGTWFHLSVLGSELLGVPPVNQTVDEGKETRFECLAKDPNARVVWSKDGDLVSDLADIQDRSSTSPDGTLLVMNTQPTDAGWYKCEVVSTTGQIQSASAYLRVHYKARVVHTPEQVFLPIGRPGAIECTYIANPPVTRMRWEKDGFLFDPFNVPGAMNRKNVTSFYSKYSLTFEKVEESHAGHYTCTPYNDVGTMGPSPSITVVVQHPPVFTVTPPNMFLRKPGDTIHLTCDALDGSTRPTIVWFKKDGKPLPADRTVMSGGNLTIVDIKESDQGLYQCVASNEAATISADTELFVENNLPRGPHNLTGESSFNSVILTWRPGVMVNSAQYSVWVRALPSQEWRTIRTTGSKATIPNLKSGREYEFMVLSQDHNGDGLSSKPFRIFTKGTPALPKSSIPLETAIQQRGEMSLGAPRGVSVSSGLEGFTIHWKPPPEAGTVDIDHYAVTLREGGDDEEDGNAILQTTQETSLYVGELKESIVYRIQIQAVTTDDMESPPIEIILHVPPVTQTAAVSLWLAALLGFALATLIICFYTNRLYVRRQIDVFKSRH